LTVSRILDDDPVAADIAHALLDRVKASGRGLVERIHAVTDRLQNAETVVGNCHGVIETLTKESREVRAALDEVHAPIAPPERRVRALAAEHQQYVATLRLACDKLIEERNRLRDELAALRAQAAGAAGLPDGWHWHGDELVDVNGTKVSMRPNGDINVSGTLFVPSKGIDAAVAAFKAKMAWGRP
jgi:hypothetical protein